MLLSIVIPIYNEQATLAQIIARVRAVELPMARQLILVDDGSSDQTSTILKDYAHDPDVIVLSHSHNQGKGAALRTGFAACQGDVILVQDADLEYNPADYPRLLEPILDGRADVVFGSRFAGGQSHRVMYYWHCLGNKFLTTLSNVFTNLNLTDMETCYKVFKSSLLKEFTIESNRFGVEPEITTKLARLKCRIYEVDISYSGRDYTEGKKINWKDGIAAFYWILKFNLWSK